ncbi:uncharacterized protein [Physcomitrium patens]|uniref:Uncharacterized protein n=1 Tax=Physcomitrium patens TaxID=3218 RepID=A0A2K1LBT6_PHYPA|nr:uncharacterized protein LOC112289812 [Physcomitrium patens]PNR63481.1 hypothetical protein PHYPA_001907 [Physcomitrium patens]|eukprot:XP_024391195.1 uncharacterized protein LOC112289812 [Physcomitrella patens]
MLDEKSQISENLVRFCFYGFVAETLTALTMDSIILDQCHQGFQCRRNKAEWGQQSVVLEADTAILDEIDSGLDLDAPHEMFQQQMA